MSEELKFLQPYFLGPAGENDQLLESLVVEFLRDHTFWRRNFHPEDGQRITAEARYRPDFLEVVARTRQELYSLSAELKRSTPFFHPRYVGHMSSDLLIPGLVARLVTTLYNPNNVSEDAAPVTMEKELQVGEQLAEMIGFSLREDREPCAWGHLTSGGTVANYEALWNFRSVKCYGIALREGAGRLNLDFGDVGPHKKPLGDYSKWELVNLSIDETIELRRSVAATILDGGSRRDIHRFSMAVRDERIEALGTAEFFLRHREIPPPRVLVSAPAHYSWEKGMKILGFGTANLVRIPVDEHMRMSVDALKDRLEDALTKAEPILAVVGTLGTTEFGTVDPIHEIIRAREVTRERGLDFGVHVDGAWGGYLMSVFRSSDGSFLPQQELLEEFRYFPTEVLYEAFRAVREADSVTVDPHKLGFVPYAAGAFLARNREIVDLIAQKAAYVFDLGDGDAEVPRREKLHNLGQYILEGSKPGAAAASVWVAHRVLPLHHEGMGRVLKQTIRACEVFYDTGKQVAESVRDRAHIVFPFEPDSNLVCMAINPVGNQKLATLNRFGRALFERMKVDAERPVQMKSFIGSYTSLQKNCLSGLQTHRILGELGIDESTFQTVPADPKRDSDHIYMLRHTLMNPFLLDGPGDRTYVDLFWEYLAQILDDELAIFLHAESPGTAPRDAPDRFKSKSKQQFGRSSGDYATSDVHSRGESLSILLEQVRPQKDWVALDVGTGAGHTALTFAPHIARVVASDITPEMLDETRRIALDRSISNVETRVADAEELPFEPGTFDLVTCRLAFHHFPRPKIAIREWRRVLRPGGTLAFSDNFTVQDPIGSERYNDYERLRDPSHFHVPSLEWLVGTIGAAGFDVQSVDIVSKDFEFHKWADRQRVSDADKANLLEMMRTIPAELEEFFQPRWTDSTMFFKLWEAVIVGTRN